MSTIPNSTVVLDPDAMDSPKEPVVIAGYTLHEQLGIGGYGEVWKAIGPGGLPKAVKILFGKMDGQRADAELKSLQRMRELRHPFLLSVERIEVFDGRLIVVTELADGCLQDRYTERTAAGERGIEREALLQYLRDAADALDFMLEEHGLQHLDIKPENLLIQGNHVKVGDFGLTKDINNTQMSLVGGFTPLFAPPEIFEGTPSPTSDQYSLAIVYQTMLTGTPPFAGRTAAQLTAQHLRSTPDLSSLQPVDRPVIARALSKNPSARFSSCRAFVDELTKRRNSRVKAKLNADGGSKLGPARTHRVEAAAMTAQGGQCDAVETTPIPPATVPTEVTYRPTVFIGIGGLGGAILSDVREQLFGAFQNRHLPAFPMLYVDSDRQSVAHQKATKDGAGLQESELLPIPLRNSNDYRGDDSLDLRWLSRRWLFNIPRSGDVEGIRPLGRLALVDHEKSIRQRIRESITSAMAPESISETSETTSFAIDDSAPEIIVVGSISGGTSSGAIQDMGGIVQDVCDELNIQPFRVHGVMLHGTSGQRQTGDIQEANCVSCLTELKHAYTPGLSQQQPFDLVTLMHLGDGLTPADFQAAEEKVAGYLFANTAGASRKVIDHWHSIENPHEFESAPLRILGIAKTDATVYGRIRTEAQNICYALLNKWRFAIATPDFATTSVLLKTLTLTKDTLSTRVMDVLRGETGANIERWSSSVCEEIDQQPGTCQERIQQIGSIFESGEDPRVPAILRSAQGAVSHSTETAAIRIREHIFSLLDAAERTNGASANLEEAIRQLEASLEWTTQVSNQVDRSLAQLESDAAAMDADSVEIHDLCKQYCAVRFYQAIYHHFVGYVTEVLSQTQTIDSEFDQLRTITTELSNRFESDSASKYPPQVVDAFDKHVLSSNNFQLIDLLNSQVENEECVERLINDAHAFLTAGSTASGTQSNRQFPEDAVSHFTNIGGRRRVLAVLPEEVDADHWMEKTQSIFGDCVTAQRSSGNSLTVYSEVEDVEFGTLLHMFINRNPKLVDFAARVRTRVDISM